MDIRSLFKPPYIIFIAIIVALFAYERAQKLRIENLEKEKDALTKDYAVFKKNSQKVLDLSEKRKKVYEKAIKDVSKLNELAKTNPNDAAKYINLQYNGLFNEFEHD